MDVIKKILIRCIIVFIGSALFVICSNSTIETGIHIFIIFVALLILPEGIRSKKIKLSEKIIITILLLLMLFLLIFLSYGIDINMYKYLILFIIILVVSIAFYLMDNGK